ncbi:hypothetical protein LTR15_012944 [Elasticomyces elasticus]|nr:hypothetical protein LTR15_012944 [Elasticomyces elasticus]
MPRPQSSTDAVLDTLEPDTLDLYYHWIMNDNIDLIVVSRIQEQDWWYQPDHEATELVKLYIANLRMEDDLSLRHLIIDKLADLSEIFQRRDQCLFEGDLIALVWDNTPRLSERREFMLRCCAASAYELMAHDERLPVDFVRERAGWCLTMRGRRSWFDIPRSGKYFSFYKGQPEEAVEVKDRDFRS